MPEEFVGTKAEFDAKISDNTKVVVDFTATWCPPCKMIAPRFAEFSEEFTDIVFFKVDVDKNDEISAACGISAMPTFQFYKDGEKVDELTGANESTLKDKLTELNAM